MPPRERSSVSSAAAAAQSQARDQVFRDVSHAIVSTQPGWRLRSTIGPILHISRWTQSICAYMIKCAASLSLPGAGSPCLCNVLVGLATSDLLTDAQHSGSRGSHWAAKNALRALRKSLQVHGWQPGL